MGDEEKSEDDRLEFILTYLTMGSKLRQDKWFKFIAVEENMKIVQKFFDNGEEKMLILTIPITGQLTPYLSFHKDIKQKFTYFIRKKKEKITMENFRDVVVFGDMISKPVEELASILDGVFVPVLSNPRNQKGWPKVVADDVVKHVRNFKATVDQVKGAMKSITILPLPAGISRIFTAVQTIYDSGGEDVDFTLKKAAEEALMKWDTTTHDILKQSPNIIFLDGKNPIPHNELDFWNLRNKNLESIYDQLRDPRIKKMGEFLECTKSSYLVTFRTLLKDIVAALVEARDVCIYMKALLPFVGYFEGDFFECEDYIKPLIHVVAIIWAESKTLLKDIVAALVEARDVCIYMKALLPFVGYFDGDFFECEDYIKPLIHVVAIIWAESKYYSTNDRIVNLFKMIVNTLLYSADIALDPGNIFLGDAEEVHKKVQYAISLFNKFMDAFEYVRANLESYYKSNNDNVHKPWNFHRRLVFQRIIDFNERLEVIDEILVIQVDYIKLEKIELGGVRGKLLGNKVIVIYEEFNKLYQIFTNITYEILDLNDMRILDDCARFKAGILDLDRRLAAIFSQAYDDCYTLESIFKFLTVVGTLIKRPVIGAELDPKVPNILDIFNAELDTVKELYDEGKKFGIPLNKYLAPVSGKLLWISKLRNRIEVPAKQFKELENGINQSEAALYIFTKCQQWNKILDREADSTFKAWVKTVAPQIQKSMSKCQLVRHSDMSLALNMDPELQAILKEVRYLQILNVENIPDAALEIFNDIVSLNDALMKFYRIIEWYNYLRSNTTRTEFNLIAHELSDIDKVVDSIIDEKNWYTHDAELVQRAYDALQSLIQRVKQAQINLKDLVNSISEWSQKPLYTRKDNKKENLLYLDDRDERLQKFYDAIDVSDALMDWVIDENFKLFFNIIPEEPVAEEDGIEEAPPPPPPPEPEPEGKKKKGGKDKKVKGKAAKKPKKTESEIAREEAEAARLLVEEERKQEQLVTWAPYLQELDYKIKDLMFDCIHLSMLVFLEETNEKSGNCTPFIEVVMELHDEDIEFNPSVDIEESDNLLVRMESLLDDIYDMGTHLKRAQVDMRNESFYEEIRDHKEVQTKSDEFCAKILAGMDACINFTKEFEEYKPLWTDDRSIYLEQFLIYGKRLTHEEELTLEDETIPNAVKEAPPSIDQFKVKIDYYEGLYKRVEKMSNNKLTMGGWLRIDIKRLRQTILNIVCKWGNLFKNHLYDKVIKSLNDLDDFIAESIRGMQVDLGEDDYEGLLKVMAILFTIKDRTTEIDAMFNPLKQIMELLAEYGFEFEEDVHVQMQEIPDRWHSCKKAAAVCKQRIAPLQAMQALSIKRRTDVFEARQHIYRHHFKKRAFFSFTCEDPYSYLDKGHRELISMEEERNVLNEQSKLFEILIPDFRGVTHCRKELRQAKHLWDYVIMCNSSLSEWKETPWKKIDVESMDLEIKKMAKELRAMEKEVKVWDVYTSMEAALKNMLTSLRAITELQNPAIRERHWIQLMQATKVRFVMTDSTTLRDLLALELHKYEEEVKTIVDKSVKEMAMEKVIKELNNVWTSMEFGLDLHERSKVKVLVLTEEVLETLEEHQAALQNMMASKFIAFFLTEVSEWQKKLSNADQVIQVYFEVQRKWMYLESIFIGSEDIRNQLPEDSKRFEKIDRDFKEILKELSANLNIIKSTNKSGLYERLDHLSSELTLCEKALNDYLDTKRLAFPRFYFVSSADLLDILSNGNSPELIQRHLTKLFDSIAKLKFITEGGKPTKKAKAMESKEEELVPFPGILDCSGKVEIWLKRVIDMMKLTLHKCFAECIVTYDDKPRELWIGDYPAQPALCGTQIWWTTEVNMAFAKLEEGYENAMKEYQKKQINQLNALIALLLGDLTPNERQKIMTICTIDVHSRDVVAKMIVMKVESSAAFQWQSQLRHKWDDKRNDCYGNICDAEFLYQYEYLGDTPRLVITPLTDRCYITLTQSLHLIMGGAPAGPAGTGKTETTKDLGKALGIMVYVFNCSEQMDYRSIGNIYKGLAQSGCWGCFDEFNRISIEVLSVVAVQVKTIQDAIKAKKITFFFLGQDIKLVPTIGLFITMNPGYAGRTELPENLKALFRPCAMVVPDFALICEIMLVAEGFMEARLLARKFISLYTLCKELLTKQDHYDWGLRAIKSVLVVAGALKRGDRQRPEDQVLMRALRDFNIPKIVTDDLAVFMGLIGDLFPALDVPRKRNIEFEKMCRKTVIDLALQPEESFLLKVVQLDELFAVRHSVFIIGFAGTGKSMVWKSLNRTYYNLKMKPMYNDLNPKAVTNDELFGIITPATREWKDGLFSAILRDQAIIPGISPKWIVLDGDIDPMWIESLNTVMDDNKVLTLASNERIALTKGMRLLFEIANLRTATPATVSRAGILYINPQDVGWNSFTTSWIDTRSNQTEKATLSILFEKYIPSCLEVSKGKFKKITPISDVAHLNMLCLLLDCFLTPENVPYECPKEWYEVYFVFSIVWAYGSSLFQDQMTDWRNEFSKWFTNEFKTIKFPSAGNVFSYYVDQTTKKFLPWTDLVKSFELDSDIPLQATLVNTAETTRIRFFIDNLIAKRAQVMLVGPAGSGKTVIVHDKLNSLNDDYAVTNVPFNFYTTSEMLQNILEKPLEKKAGRCYGPPGNKIMIYFVDDMNMPEVDKYYTVQPHTILRQYMDYQHWYDRQKLSLKDILNVLFISCMNPSAGSFTINPRLLRHFCVFSVGFPSPEACTTIYYSIYSQHVADPIQKFAESLQKTCADIVKIALLVHLKTSAVFLPTAIKFHYTFTLRDLSNIFQGMLFASGNAIKDPTDMMRLWFHEASRVYKDKLVDRKDQETWQKLVRDLLKKTFEKLDDVVVFAQPLIFCHFAKGIGDPKYFPINDFDQLSRLLNDALAGYNEIIAVMNLVLFEDAMYHICRINRIMEAPRGNALLVGVGGSGKQSLTRLSAFISSFDVFQIQLKKGYSMLDMKADIAGLYTKIGLKSVGITFLMTDAQVPEESYLVLVNDMLASGEISDLLSDEDTENVINAMRGEVKGVGLQDTRENCWKFFIERVRRLLKIILSFSPVGSTLRVRARKFPALVNSTSIDWFQEWPQEALESVSHRFVAEIEVLPKDLVRSVSLFMSYVHTVANNMSEVYLANEKRYNYTTPKSFLEQIDLYSKLLTEKTHDVIKNIGRLENGILKLKTTSLEVDALKKVLAVQEVELAVKNEAAGKIIAILSAENEKVAAEQEIASEEEKKVKVIEEDVSEKARICEDDLARAEPALLAAQEALNVLNKNNLTELKSFGSPPEVVVTVVAAVAVLFAKKGQIPKDRSWKASKLLMSKVDVFLNDLLNFDANNITPQMVQVVQDYVKDPEFDPENVATKSTAAAGLCSWVINMLKYYDVFVVVEPKRRALAAANKELNQARAKLALITEKITLLEEQLAALKAEFDAAMAEKMKCQAEADATNSKIDIANRLVGGLSSEKVRWGQLIEDFKTAILTLPGDVLLITAFISYVGCFTKNYRVDMMTKYWMPFLLNLEVRIPMTEGVDPLSLLTDDAKIAQWNNEGLPTDRMSTENACILTNSARWPLMIDPQLQGVKWIKTKYEDDLVIVRPTQKAYIDKIEKAIGAGHICLLENIGETIDAVLDNVLGRVLIKKGTCVKVGDAEVDWDRKFRLILHTKLANPHYKPEIQAQATLINFTVTRDGLEEQLLAEVVKAERPDLDSLKKNLTKSQNDFKIILKNCEDNLLYRLSSATGNILEDIELVVNLETTKKTAIEITKKMEEAKITSVKIDQAREQYRTCATRASLIYFLLNDLNRINAIYQFSLKAFSVVFINALEWATPAETLDQRVVNLLDSITFSVFMYTSRGLFEKDKLTFTSQLVIQILLQQGEIDPTELDFLLRYPAFSGMVSPVDFLTNMTWGGIKALCEIGEFMKLDKDITGSAKRWQKYVDSECPEKEKLPGEWKNKSLMQQLCIMRCLRPDRMTYAMTNFIVYYLSNKYVTARAVEFAKSYEETSAQTPVFFILSPGVNPLKDVEALGKKLGFTFDKGNFHSVSLGQGQEIVAENAMDTAAEFGHWVILQNIHLVVKWLATLEKKMEQCADSGNESYRLYLSAEPSPDPQECVIPQGILESSIKITNEPPTGMFANLHKALDNFSQETLEMCSKEAEFKAILFSLCYFHAVVAERRKFGPQGWNRNYPFNVGDLTISVNVLQNYLENNSKVPWEDLRYLFGEIMYGGHITDDWDRRLCRSYLLNYMIPELLDGELLYAEGFACPPNLDYAGYHKYIDDRLPPESPYLYGLHPNAEIGFLATTSENMFRTILEMQPRDSGAAAGVGLSPEDKVKGTLEDIQDRLPDSFPVTEMLAKVEDRNPYIIVAFQECERMNTLTTEMKRSLKELELGLKGELTISADMETLYDALFMDQVPESWSLKAYPSMLPLAQWCADLTLRLRELDLWLVEFSMPATIWLGGFFNPQSFLTAIMQQTARKNEWPLDKMCLMTDVTKKQKEDFTTPPREGAYIYGLFMEGARWEIQLNSIVDSKLKDLFPTIPVVFIKAVTQDKQELRNMYECPVYKTRMRGPTYVWTFNLKTKDRPLKWILAGVAILLQI